MNDLISRQAAIETLKAARVEDDGTYKWRTQRNLDLEFAALLLETIPPAQPEQLEQCPIYGGMCAYPSDQCYDCPRHAGAKMGVTE